MHDNKKYLLIMRHAKSDRNLDDVSDFDRPLNDRGEGEPKIIAKELNRLGITMDRAIVSSSRRTMDTWLLLERKLDKAPDVIFDKRLYNAVIDDVLDVLLEEAGDAKSLLMIGHNPSVSEIFHYLTGETHEFKPATCAVLSARQASLEDSLTKPACFNVEHIFTAK